MTGISEGKRNEKSDLDQVALQEPKVSKQTTAERFSSTSDGKQTGRERS